jgi:RNA polymerase sigma-70 factor (ECF subfamily)
MATRRNGIERKLESFHPSSYGWALVCCRWNRQEAEDVLQTSYLKAIEGRAKFNGHSSTRTWFFAVVRTTALERRRRAAVRSLAIERLRRWITGSDSAPTPERLTEIDERRDRLRRSMTRLSPRQREMLHLVFYQDLTIEEASHILGISVGSARTHYQRGKTRLRKLLAEDGKR